SQRSHHYHRKRRHLYRPFGRRWSRRFVEDNQSAGRRSPSSSVRAGQNNKDDLQRFRSELGLDGYELHAGNLHPRQRSVREVCRRVSAENGEEGKDRKRGQEIIFLVVGYVRLAKASQRGLARSQRSAVV